MASTSNEGEARQRGRCWHCWQSPGSPASPREGSSNMIQDWCPQPNPKNQPALHAGLPGHWRHGDPHGPGPRRENTQRPNLPIQFPPHATSIRRKSRPARSPKRISSHLASPSPQTIAVLLREGAVVDRASYRGSSRIGTALSEVGPALNPGGDPLRLQSCAPAVSPRRPLIFR